METEGSERASAVVDYLGFDREQLKEYTTVIFTKKTKAPPQPVLPTFDFKKYKIDTDVDVDISSQTVTIPFTRLLISTDFFHTRPWS
jgi:hypothetical protein